MTLAIEKVLPEPVTSPVFDGQAFFKTLHHSRDRVGRADSSNHLNGGTIFFAAGHDAVPCQNDYANTGTATPSERRLDNRL